MRIIFGTICFLFLFFAQICTVSASHLRGACFIVAINPDGGVYVFEIPDRVSTSHYKGIIISDARFINSKQVCEGSKDFYNMLQAIKEEVDTQKENNEEADYPAIRLPSVSSILKPRR